MQSAGEKFFSAYCELSELQAEADEERKRQQLQERQVPFPLVVSGSGGLSGSHSTSRHADVHAELIQQLDDSERQNELLEEMLEGRRTQIHELVDRVQELINELCERPMLVTESNLISEALTHVELIVLSILSQRSSAPSVNSPVNRSGTLQS